MLIGELVLENVFLRSQLIVLNRQVKRPRLTAKDRILMLWLASKLPHWKQALLTLQPDTVLHWHRDLFKWLWRRKSRHTGGKSPVRKESCSNWACMSARAVFRNTSNAFELTDR